MSVSRVPDVKIYNDVARVWVEWLTIENTWSPVQRQSVRQRIKTLSLMLETAPESFQIAKCIGYLEDQTNAPRLGFVYRVPLEFGASTPVSLLHVIETGRKLEPPLGDKFKLAQSLATTLMQLHTSDWLHKAVQSDNVLFFESRPSITKPHLAGFEYARDIAMESMRLRPTGENELDYFYHPDVVFGYSKGLDLYSMGVVLLEVAFWRPLGRKIKKIKETQKVETLDDIRNLMIETAGNVLDARMGAIYGSVVRTCLKCEFPSPTARSAEFACAVNTEMVLRLEKCHS